ncbi:MAG: hypothetical protein ACRD1H_02560, partial [Vicinamibacterales bacterium]
MTTIGQTATDAATMSEAAQPPRVHRGLFAPVGWVIRIRRAFLILNMILIVLLIQTVSLTAPVDETARLASIAALTWLGFRWLREYVVPSRSAIWDCADGLALFGAGLTITSLESASGILYLSLLYSSLCFRSLSYYWRRVTIGILVYMIVLLGITIMAQQLAGDGPVSLLGPTHFPALAAVALVAHLLVMAVRQREHESAHTNRIAEAAIKLANASRAD